MGSGIDIGAPTHAVTETWDVFKFAWMYLFKNYDLTVTETWDVFKSFAEHLVKSRE